MQASLVVDEVESAEKPTQEMDGLDVAGFIDP